MVGSERLPLEVPSEEPTTLARGNAVRWGCPGVVAGRPRGASMRTIESRPRRQRKKSPKAGLYQRAWVLRSKYGLTMEQWRVIFDGQGGRCAACGMIPDGGRVTSLCVDHCHATGRIRGLLCTPCNVALGLLRDDPARLEALATYARSPGHDLFVRPASA